MAEKTKDMSQIKQPRQHYLTDETLEQKRNQAKREGGLILTLSGSAAGNTSLDEVSGGQAEREDGQLLILPFEKS